MENETDRLIEEIIRLRALLHENPEASMQEYKTKEILQNYLKEKTNLEITDCGSWFYAMHRAECSETEKEPAIAFRGDMDAVAGKDGHAGHYCGHDGHCAVLAGFGKMLSEKKTKRDVYLIFQPAEETGQGAVLCRSLLQEKQIGEIYGFHNIPGYEQGKVLLRKGTFACASTGLEITLYGTPSHAAYPEYGKNPSYLLSRLVLDLPEMLNRTHKGMLLATVIGMETGSDSYGVAASKGILRLTVRGEYEEEFEELLKNIREKVQLYAHAEEMQYHIREIERFPAVNNTSECVMKLEQAALRTDLRTVYLAEPMRWSEDFGYYLREIRGAFFGIGDGTDYPQLHTEDFQFPDAIIPAVLKVYNGLL